MFAIGYAAPIRSHMTEGTDWLVGYLSATKVSVYWPMRCNIHGQRSLSDAEPSVVCPFVRPKTFF